MRDSLWMVVSLVGYALALFNFRKPRLWVFCGWIAVLAQAIVLHHQIDAGHTQNLSLLNMLSCLFWMNALFVMLIAWRKEIPALSKIVFPLAGLSLLAMVLLPQQTAGSQIPSFQLIHILSSMLTLSVMLLAAMQALMLLGQDYFLRHAKTSTLATISPDLESMEIMLFRIIFCGVWLLTGIIISSFYFFFDLHWAFFLKLSVSVVAWLVFAALLGWRHFYGLRGRAAVISTLLGVGILLAVYVGSLIF